MKRKSSTLLVLGLLIGSIAAAQARPASYRIVPLQFPVPDDFEATSINCKFQIAVSIDTQQDNRMWLGSNGHYQQLTIPANEGRIEIRAENDLSHILGLGFHDPNAGYDHGFIWRRGQFEDLIPPSGTTMVNLFEINNRDQVVGYLTDSAYHTRPVVWEEGHFSDLPVLPGAVPSNWWNGTEVYQINDAGIAVGHSSLSDALQPIPVVWVSGSIRQLPLPDNGRDGYASAINNRGHIIGAANMFTGDPSFPQEPLFWHDGGVTILPVPQGDTLPVATGINDRDQITGYSATSTGLSHVLLWDHGAVYDLLSLVSDADPLKPGLELVFAERILDSGAIEVLAHNGSQYGLYLLLPST